MPKRVVIPICKLLGYILLGIAWIWCAAGAYSLDNYISHLLTVPLSIVLLIGVPVWIYRQRGVSKWLVGTLVLACIGLIVVLQFQQPQHDRVWSESQAILPTATIEKDAVSIKSVRSFRYDGGKLSKHYFDIDVELLNIKSVWFGVDRFSSIHALAHTFLSFEIESENQPRYLSFSVETRREKGEEMFSPVRGIFRNYEVIYVIADEQDVLSLRSDIRQHIVQLYPLKATQAQAREMFVSMLRRANQLERTPEFYNTLTNNCTNNLVSHANTILETPINAASLAVVFPGYADWLVYSNDMIDTTLDLDQAREEFRIDQRALEYDGTSDFSQFIRRGMPRS